MKGWFLAGSHPTDYIVGIDDAVSYKGKKPLIFKAKLISWRDSVRWCSHSRRTVTATNACVSRLSSNRKASPTGLGYGCASMTMMTNCLSSITWETDRSRGTPIGKGTKWCWTFLWRASVFISASCWVGRARFGWAMFASRRRPTNRLPVRRKCFQTNLRTWISRSRFREYNIHWFIFGVYWMKPLGIACAFCFHNN